MSPSPVFVAIDTTETGHAVLLASRLAGLVGGLKVGLEFFAAQGAVGVEAVSHLGQPVFLDLKLHDIPNTVAGAMRGIARLAPRFTTVHASGGHDMMKAAVDAGRDEAAKRGLVATKVLAVTVLTSLDTNAMQDVGFQPPVLDQVKRLAELAQRAGIDGLVCSPHEVAEVRRLVGPDLTLVVPGIRPSWSETGDQKRVMTPREAMAQGADILVIGRPITAHHDVAAAARRIAEELV
jgi:orotidine-5'-phosphate decarboxylase